MVKSLYFVFGCWNLVRGVLVGVKLVSEVKLGIVCPYPHDGNKNVLSRNFSKNFIKGTLFTRIHFINKQISPIFKLKKLSPSAFYEQKHLFNEKL